MWFITVECWILLFALLTLYDAAKLARQPQQEQERLRYDNFSVYKIFLEDDEQHEQLLKLMNSSRNDYKIWSDGQNEMTLMVGPTGKKRFHSLIESVGMRKLQLISNVQKLIDDEDFALKQGDSHSFHWNSYHHLNEIYKWMDHILKEYPDETSGFVIGKSYEKRHIRGIKISYSKNNPGIFIESNIHAREWITSATATWLIEALLTAQDEFIRELAEEVDWYIVPVVNVDGYVYSHEVDRMWRKTRSKWVKSDCYGVDPNRNFDIHWLIGKGSSIEPCSENYAGPHAQSEPEVKGLADYLKKHNRKFNIVLSFHAYNQLILSPFGFSANKLPPNYEDLMSVAQAYAHAIKNMPYSTTYNYGNAGAILYIATGTTLDWAYEHLHTRMVYTIEFRDKGEHGFLLPPDQIIPNAEETLKGIWGMVQKASALGYLQVKKDLDA